MIKSITRLVVALLVMAVVGAIYVASTKEPASKSAGGGRRGGGFNSAEIPVPVTGTEVRRTNVPLYLDGVGTSRALNTVTVRPQADGRIIKVHFREGERVEKGTLLAEIDQTPYKALLDQVSARRAVTETQLANAKRDAERYARIPGVVAQKTVDNQAAQVAQFEAQLRADDASIVSARANLDYTRITAPISGRTGLRLVDEGNIVRAGADSGLVTITQVQPISILFNLPQQQLQRVNRAQARGTVAVTALDADGKSPIDQGMLQVIDNQVDQTTGTVRMKADFPNAQLQLWPGQFANVRLHVETLNQVVVVPTTAVQRGPNGTFVYVVTAEERAKVRPVELTMQLEVDTIVSSGLQPGERVITAGFARMQDNARVIFTRQGDSPPPVTGTDGKTAPAASAAPGGGDQRGRFARIREACGPELAQHCPGIARDQMRACMVTNAAKFSAVCQAAMEASAAETKTEGGNPAGRQATGSSEGQRKRDGAATPTPVVPAGSAAAAPVAKGPPQ